MRFAGLALVLSCPLLLAAKDDPPVKWTDALNQGLHGPVRTVKLISERLPDYPRINPQIPIWAHDAWMVFNPNGEFMERSNSLREDGTPEVISRETKGADGRIVGSEAIRDGQKTTWETEYVDGPHGPSEIRVYQNGALQSVSQNSYDENGRISEEVVHDATGRILSHTRYERRGGVMELETRGSDDEFFLHVVDTYTNEGELVMRQSLNAEGRVIMSLAFRDYELISSWRDPECHGGAVGVGTISGDVDREYRVLDDCRIEIIVERHPGRRGNLENDDIERFSEAGESLEKLTFQYERDNYGNWTRRVVSAFDLSTNTLVPIEEGTRTITYYH